MLHESEMLQHRELHGESSQRDPRMHELAFETLGWLRWDRS